MENDLEKACKICKELAEVLDSKQKSVVIFFEDMDKECIAAVTSACDLLVKMPLEIFFLSARQELGLDRIVKYSLDEHPTFGKMQNELERIVRAVGHRPGDPIDKIVEGIREYEQGKNTDVPQSGGDLPISPAGNE